MRSEQTIQAFVERVQQVVKLPGVLVTGIAGTTSKRSVQLDLLREASLLSQVTTDKELDKQIEKVVGVLHVAQAMNAIGSEDLERLIELLDKINGSN